MLEYQLGYLAGLIDGEGTITLYLRSDVQTMRMRVVVYSTTEEVIEWLLVHFDGKKQKMGRRANPKHSQEFAWYLDGDKAYDLLELIFPYLIIKKAKAQVACEAWRNRQPIPRGKRLDGIPLAILQIRKDYIEAFKQN